MDGGMSRGEAETHSLSASPPAWGLFLVTGSGPLLLTPSVKLLRCSVRCSSDTETEENTDTHKSLSLSLSIYLWLSLSVSLTQTQWQIYTVSPPL